MARKCMICGYELGEREQYCGNCGSKAPDGATDKEDVEIKYATEERKEYEPRIFYTWTAHNFFFNQSENIIFKKKTWTRTIYAIYTSQYYSYVAYTIFNLKLLFSQTDTISLSTILETSIHIIFAIIFILISESSLKISKNLILLKKSAPKYLYISCIARALSCPLYAIYLIMVNKYIYNIIGVIAIIEGVCGLISLIISKKYYEKRKSAFIN